MVDIRLITEIYDSNTILFNFLGVLLLGYLGGFLVKNTILRVSKIMGLDEIMKSSKIQMVFKELGYKGTAINLIADVVKWFVYLLALSSAFEILSMHEISTIFAVIVRYIPNIAIAITVIVIGIFAADLFARIVSELVSTGDKTGEMSGIAAISSSFARVVLYIITLIIALKLLGVDPTAITVVMAVLLTAASALFVLSMRDIAPSFMAGIHMKKSDLKEKDKITVSGISGTITEFGTLSTTIKSGRKTFVIPNSHFIRDGFERV